MVKHAFSAGRDRETTFNKTMSLTLVKINHKNKLNLIYLILQLSWSLCMWETMIADLSGTNQHNDRSKNGQGPPFIPHTRTPTQILTPSKRASEY